MKTFLNKIFLICFFILSAFSCKDFLEEDLKAELLSATAFTQASDLDGAVNVLYRQVSRSTFGATQFIDAFMGDDLSTHQASNKASFREWDTFSLSTSNDRLLWCWQDKYLVIKAANYIINGAGNTPGATEDEINYALNQAHFWRAWAYFYLVRTFGPLPKINTIDVDFSVGLSTISDIYDMIVSDLKEAENLPEKYTEVPQAMNGVNVVANKGAAQSMLAYVYMCMAGWPLNKGTEYYKLAAAKALEVIQSVENGTYYYTLYDEFWKIHSKQENSKNQETIVAVYYSDALGTGDSSEAARGGINDIPDCSGGYNDSRAEIGFYCNFPEGPRKDATYPSVTYYTGDKKAYPWWSESLPEANRYPYFGKSAFTSDDNTAGTYEYDFTKSFSDQSSGWSEQIHQLIRLSEVYCWYAESIGRSGETNSKAIELLNKVRNRANGNGPVDDSTVNYYPSNMSAEELAEAAYNEHGWEIAGWYWGAIATRYNDMQRMDRVGDYYNTRKTNPEYTIPESGGIKKKEPFAPTGEWSECLMFAPYPAEDVGRNSALDISLEEKLNLIY
jgi:starch-binding outer membrane protein, SusD/RagB family